MLIQGEVQGFQPSSGGDAKGGKARKARESVCSSRGLGQPLSGLAVSRLAARKPLTLLAPELTKPSWLPCTLSPKLQAYTVGGPVQPQHQLC